MRTALVLAAGLLLGAGAAGAGETPGPGPTAAASAPSAAPEPEYGAADLYPILVLEAAGLVPEEVVDFDVQNDFAVLLTPEAEQVFRDKGYPLELTRRVLQEEARERFGPLLAAARPPATPGASASPPSSPSPSPPPEIGQREETILDEAGRLSFAATEARHGRDYRGSERQYQEARDLLLPLTGGAARRQALLELARVEHGLASIDLVAKRREEAWVHYRNSVEYFRAGGYERRIELSGSAGRVAQMERELRAAGRPLPDYNLPPGVEPPAGRNKGGR